MLKLLEEIMLESQRDIIKERRKGAQGLLF
jgi:hypothetical protein